MPTRKKYKFRVLAENLAGPGKPSKETDQIMIKDPIGKIQHFMVDLFSTLCTTKTYTVYYTHTIWPQFVDT